MYDFSGCLFLRYWAIYIYIVIICCSVCDVINQSFLIKPFFYIAKKSGQKFRICQEQKELFTFFIIFKGLPLKQTKITFFVGENPTLRSPPHNFTRNTDTLGTPLSFTSLNMQFIINIGRIIIKTALTWTCLHRQNRLPFTKETFSLLLSNYLMLKEIFGM